MAPNNTQTDTRYGRREMDKIHELLCKQKHEDLEKRLAMQDKHVSECLQELKKRLSRIEKMGVGFFIFLAGNLLITYLAQ